MRYVDPPPSLPSTAALIHNLSYDIVIAAQHCNRRHRRPDPAHRERPRLDLRRGPRLHQRDDLPRAVLRRVRRGRRPGRDRDYAVYGCDDELGGMSMGDVSYMY